MFKNLRVRWELMTAFGVIVAMTLIVALTGMLGMNSIWKKSSYISAEQLPKINNLNRLSDSQKMMGFIRCKGS